MRFGMVAVWDQDREYALRLCEFLRRQNGFSSSVVSYSEPEQLKRAVDTRQVSVVVAGSPVAESEWLRDAAVLTLTEERDAGEATVYKYQSAGEVFRVILGFRERNALSGAGTCRPAAKIRGIYSPLGGCLKTSLGLVMGCLLAEEKRCLFLSLEAHSGFRTLFGRQYPMDLSDLFTAVRQKGNVPALLAETIQSFGKLQYIPPVIWPEDIREAERGELRELLHMLAQDGGFDEIILDVGTDLARPEEVLSWCDRLYCPEKEDAFSPAKLTEYDSYLRVAGYEALVGRIQRIPLAGLSCGIAAAQLNQWQRWEQMLPVVRGILAEEAGGDE